MEGVQRSSLVWRLEMGLSGGGVLKVFRGALVVIKGKLINGLYHLQGSTILGSANVSSTVDSDAASTQLWHMCIGHMSERGKGKEWVAPYALF